MRLPPFPENWKSVVKKDHILKLHTNTEILDTEKIAGWYVEQIAEKNRFIIHKKLDIENCLSELLRNIKQHSRYSNFMLLGQSYPEKKMIKLAIYDDGEGIRQNITKIKYNKRHNMFKKIVSSQEYKTARNSDSTAIELAAKECVSGTNYKNNGGYGLHFITREIHANNIGKTVIISNDGLVSWNESGLIEKKDLFTGIRGTLISITTEYI